MIERPFSSMDAQSRRFYMRIFNNSILNIVAVRRGFFDTLISETDDPAVMRRWREAAPQILALIKKDSGK